ncbi:hypothetical protein P9112_009088 [Eukaryota sp. TZLM1-RC]
MASPSNDTPIQDDASRPKLDDRHKLKLLRQEFKKLHADYTTSTQLNDTLTDEIAQLKASLEELSNNPQEQAPCENCPVYEKEINQLKTQVDDLNTQISEIPVLKTSLEETEVELEAQRNKASGLLSINDELQQSNASLKDENLALKEEIFSLKQSNDSLSNDIATLKQRLNDSSSSSNQADEPETPIPAHLQIDDSEPLFSKSSLGKAPRTDGWLVKMGLFRKNWKNRFFRLRVSHKHGVILSYFKTEFCTPPLALGVFQVPSNSVKIVEDVEKYGRSFCFEITTTDRTFICQAASLADRDHWIRTIENSLEWHAAFVARNPLQQ